MLNKYSKKIIKLFCLLLWMFLFMLFIQSVYAVPAENPYSLNLCSVVLNPWEVEWYNLVVFNEDGSNPKIVKEDTCIKWRLYFLPNSIELKDIKIKEIKEKESSFDGICRYNSPKREIINKWAIYIGSLKSSCAVIDECTADCKHLDTSTNWTDRYKIICDEDKNECILSLYNWVDRIDEKNLKEDKLKARNDTDKPIDLGYHCIIQPPYNRTLFWIISYFYPTLLWASLIITLIFRLISILTLSCIYKYKKINKSIKYLIKNYWLWWIILFFIILIIITIILYLRIMA